MARTDTRCPAEATAFAGRCGSGKRGTRRSTKLGRIVVCLRALRQRSPHLRNPANEQGRDGSKLGDGLLEAEPMSLPANDDDHVRSLGEELGMQPEYFTDHSLGAVSQDGAAELAGSRDPEPGRIIRPSHDEDDVTRCRHSAPGRLNPKVLSAFADASLDGESKAAYSSGLRSPGHEVWITSGRSSRRGACGPCDDGWRESSDPPKFS